MPHPLVLDTEVCGTSVFGSVAFSTATFKHVVGVESLWIGQGYSVKYLFPCSALI